MSGCDARNSGDLRRLQARVVLLLCLASIAAPAGPSAASPQTPDEYQVKALFLYNFAKFFEWPKTMREDPLCIGVVGRDPFGGTLEKIVKSQPPAAHSFLVRHYRTAAEARDCHIVFIPATDPRRIRAALDSLNGSSVVTVGESPGFCESGGILNFELVEGTVRFEINTDAVERTGLKASSKLLSVARKAREQR